MCRHANVPMCERRVWIDDKQNTSVKRQTAENLCWQSDSRAIGIRLIVSFLPVHHSYLRAYEIRQTNISKSGREQCVHVWFLVRNLFCVVEYSGNIVIGIHYLLDIRLLLLCFGVL